MAQDHLGLITQFKEYQSFQDFKKLALEMFRVDQSDLDFGLYRVLNIKRNLIEDFLNNKILDIFIDFTKEIQDEVNPLLKRNGDFQIKLFVEDAMNRLIEFFQRYYDKGDFISQRRYSGNDTPYLIPYHGEEVKLHWANADQYYIKTGENFKTYCFQDSINKNNQICFELIDATTEQNNNRSQKERKFKLSTSKNMEMIKKDDGYVLNVYFTYDFEEETSKVLLDQAYESIKKFIHKPEIIIHFTEIIDKKSEKSILLKHLKSFFNKNSFDFFIHKNLKSFLNRELDFYLKNEVLKLDAIHQEKDLTKLILKMKFIKNLATPIIEYLTQVEEFQKKLYLKKKMVVECDYCITLDHIDERFYPEIIRNQDQIEEWQKLFAIQDIKQDLELEGFSDVLTDRFLKQNQFLLLDTRFFSKQFKWEVLSCIEGIDEKCDGLLVNGDNFQVLNLLREKYDNKVDCVYIDPPYNTGNDGFVYKDNFQDSSWLSFMHDRLQIAKNLMNDEGVIFSSIDDGELSQLKILKNQVFKDKNFVGQWSWFKSATPPNLSLKIKKNIEYILGYEKYRDNTKYKGVKKESKSDDPFIKPQNSMKILKFPINSININHSDGIITKGIYGTSKYPNILLNDIIISNNKNLNEVAFQNKFIWTQEKLLAEINNSTKINCSKQIVLSYKKANYSEEVPPNLINSTNNVDTTEEAGKFLESLFNKKVFDYPKPVSLITYLIQFKTNNHDNIILDFFAGSGTTAHAVINLNREEEISRKYILVEMGEYFNSVTKPRIQKAIYSKEWKEGKPTDRQGISQIFKYFDIESYEDTLNNIELKSSIPKNIEQNTLLKEDYILKYMINHESQEHLFNTKNFESPFKHSLNITRQNEGKLINIDLIETFNYLIGINIDQYHKETFEQEDFYLIEGSIKGRKTLIIWREYSSNDTDHLIKQNEKLNHLLQTKEKWKNLLKKPLDIMINGDHLLSSLILNHEEKLNTTNIENKYLGDSVNHFISSIEPLFYKKMFEVIE